MTNDIVAQLRLYAQQQRETKSSALGLLLSDAADEIERLRRELGQVSDADSVVSKVDAALLDNLLNWCEWNAGDSHRALQRLVNDRARLRAEVIRLRKGGCARDQTTTQFCAEAERLRNELAARCGGAAPGPHTTGGGDPSAAEELEAWRAAFRREDEFDGRCE